MKSKVTINMETFLLEEIKMNNINISQMAEDAARSLLSFKKGDIDGVNERLTKLELEKVEKKIIENQTKSAELRQILAKIQEKKEENHQKMLEKEKKIIEKSSNCNSCGRILTPEIKKQISEDLVLCRTCFLDGNFEIKKKKIKL